MVHKRLQTNIVCEDRLRSLAYTTVTACRMGSGWVELGQEETGLGATRVADDEAWEGKAVLDQLLRMKLACEKNVEGNEVLCTRASSFGASSNSLKFSYPSIS